MNDAQLASGYLLHGTLLRDFDIAMLIDLLGAEGYRYFADADRKPMEYLWQHNGCIDDLVAFRTFIGEAGNARIQALQRGIDDVELTPANGAAWCAILQSEAQRQDGLYLIDAYKAKLKGSQLPGDVLQALSVDAQALATNTTPDELISNFEAGGEARRMFADLLQGGNYSFVPTGFPFIDDNWGGFERGKIAGFGGIPGSGKTAFMAQVGYHAALSGQKVLWVQNEMTAGDMLLRQAIQQTQITKHRILNKKLTEADIALFNKVIYTLESYPVRYIHKPGVNMNQLAALVRAAERDLGGLDLLVIDHAATLKPIDSRTGSDSPTWLIDIYKDMKNVLLPQFRHTAVVSLQHLNTNLFRLAGDDLSPTQNDFNYQTAHIFNQAMIVLRPPQHARQLKDYREDVLASLAPSERQQREKDAFLHVVKNREGASEVSQKFSFDGKYYLWSQV